MDDKKDRTEKVMAVLSTLPEREGQVLRLRFGVEDGLPRTLKEIAEALGMEETRVRQIEANALRMLRHPPRSGNLRSILDEI